MWEGMLSNLFYEADYPDIKTRQGHNNKKEKTIEQFP
jgi:hypothetical protein